MNLTTAEKRLKILLKIFTVAFLIAVLIYEFGPLIGPFKGFFKQLPFVSNSVVKVSLLMMLCLYAAGNIRKRLELVKIIIAAHVISLLAMFVFLIFTDTSQIVNLGFVESTIGNVLWGAVVLDGIITLIILVFAIAPMKENKKLNGNASSSKEHQLTRAEKRFQVILSVFGFLFILAGAGYEVGPLLFSIKDFFIQLSFVSNSVVKVTILAMICLYVAKDIRSNISLAGLLIAGHVVSVVALLIFIMFTDTGYSVQIGTNSLIIGNILWGAVAMDLVIGAVLLFFYFNTLKERFNLQFLWPVEFRSLISLADVLVAGKDEKLTPQEIAANVDHYVVKIRAKRRWVYRAVLVSLQFHPLLYLKAPFTELDEESRLKHLKKHFYKDVIQFLIPDWWRQMVQAMIRVAKQLTFVGYYNDPKTFESIGYVPFSQRERYKKLEIPESKPHPLDVETPAQITVDKLETDVCIVGSGAAGAILAYNLAKAGRDVLVVERGKYVEPREFSEDEVEMIGKLYADGLFQQTRDYRFTVLQGSCVGGTTVVNNAVSFKPPDNVLSRWNDPAIHHAGLDLKDLDASNEEIIRFLSIAEQSGAPLNPSYPKFIDGVQKFDATMDSGVISANIKDCLGCGYCNIGCAYGKKLSMLDTALPWAQRDFPGKVRIVAECEVDRIRSLSGSIKQVSDVKATLSDGRKITIKANTYVLAAGAIASSYLMIQSGIGNGLPVGKNLCFNMGSPLTAEYDDKMNAYDGLQISHYGLPQDKNRGFVYETWWNPPVAQAINMPGWFEDHFENMRRYPYLMAVGVLVGTKGNGQVKKALTGGADIDYVPDKEDLAKLADGLKHLGNILFESGARRVMANTWSYDVFTEPKELEKLDQITLDTSRIALGTGHPQGGNAISKDPKRGVVDSNFLVHGYKNLYVCDASVFPSSLTVNPQLTVMGLAHYASSRIK